MEDVSKQNTLDGAQHVVKGDIALTPFELRDVRRIHVFYFKGF